MGLLTFLAKRFVAGETAADAVAAAQRVQARGMGSIVDFLGEHVTSAEEAAAAVKEYRRLIQALDAGGVEAAVSLKVSQMGLAVSSELCLENLKTIARQAGTVKRMVWIDMEGSDLTQRTLDVFERLRAACPNVGLCLQAYLVRTGADLDRLMRQPVKIRLCKGAYKEPPTVAYPTKSAVEGSYRMLAQKMIETIPRGTYPAFATHDRSLIRYLLELVSQRKTEKSTFEFEMLYGIENDYLESLAAQGYRTQVYIPYGHQWLPYFLRRLRERKENVYFLLRNIFRM